MMYVYIMAQKGHIFATKYSYWTGEKYNRGTMYGYPSWNKA